MKKLLLLLITLVTLTNLSHASFPVSDTIKVKQNIEETIKYSSYGNSQTIVDQIFQVLGFLSLILSVVGLILILTPLMEDGVIRRIPIILFATTFGLIGLFKKKSRILSIIGLFLSFIAIVIGMVHLFVWIRSYGGK